MCRCKCHGDSLWIATIPMSSNRFMKTMNIFLIFSFTTATITLIYRIACCSCCINIFSNTPTIPSIISETDVILIILTVYGGIIALCRCSTSRLYEISFSIPVICLSLLTLICQIVSVLIGIFTWADIATTEFTVISKSTYSCLPFIEFTK